MEGLNPTDAKAVLKRMYDGNRTEQVNRLKSYIVDLEDPIKRKECHGIDDDDINALLLEWRL